MIVVLKHNVPDEKRNQLITWLRNQQIDVHPSLGEYQTVLGLVGDTSRIDMSPVSYTHLTLPTICSV